MKNYFEFIDLSTEPTEFGYCDYANIKPETDIEFDTTDEEIPF